MPSYLALSAADVRRALTVESAIASQREAFSALADGTAALAPKVGVDGEHGAIALNYTARLSPSAPAVAKLVSVDPANAERGLPTIHGVITVLDPATGQLAAVMDGTPVTTLRTAAATALAVQVLAPQQVRRIAVVGTGVQADAHVRALCADRDAQVVIVGRRPSVARELAATLSAELGRQVGATDDAATAVAASDVVVLCTSSSTPVIRHAWLSAGATVVSVGSFTPERTEVETETVGAADLVVVDDVATSLEHAGSIMDALESGALQQDSITTLGDVLTGRHPGRRSADDLVFYNSVGIGVQDAAAAAAVLQAATELGLGTRVQL